MGIASEGILAARTVPSFVPTTKPHRVLRIVGVSLETLAG
jgi:hypothetical protein